MLKKIISFVLSFTLIASQPVFAQSVAQINLGNYLRTIGSSVAMDKFRPLHMRYFSYDMATDNFQLLLDKGDNKDIKEAELEEKTKVLMDYFKIGLSLPNEKFWVNLRPDAQDQIIDPELEKTDIGKIMLEADLQLKKDTASLTSPQNPEGKAYWDKLYKKAGELFGSENITIPTITRPWIVPGEIILRQGEDSAYIFKANMKVMLEQDHLKGSQVYDFKDPRMKELNEYSSQLIRELIIPKLTKEVNISKRYAPLRQVFFSLVMARWFKDTFGSSGSISASGHPSTTLGASQSPDSSYVKLIDSGDLANLTSKEAWSKTYYFNEYKKSFEKGEYNLKEDIATPTGQVIRSYVSGGVSSAIMTMPPAGDFKNVFKIMDMPGIKVSSAVVEYKEEIEQKIREFKEKIITMANEAVKSRIVPQGMLGQDIKNGNFEKIIDTLALFSKRAGDPKAIAESANLIKEGKALDAKLERRNKVALISDVIGELYESYKANKITANEAVRKILMQMEVEIRNKDESQKSIEKIERIFELMANVNDIDNLLYVALLGVAGYQEGRYVRIERTVAGFSRFLGKALFVAQEMYREKIRYFAKRSTNLSKMEKYLDDGDIALALIGFIQGEPRLRDDKDVKEYEEDKRLMEKYLESTMMIDELVRSLDSSEKKAILDPDIIKILREVKDFAGALARIEIEENKFYEMGASAKFQYVKGVIGQLEKEQKNLGALGFWSDLKNYNKKIEYLSLIYDLKMVGDYIFPDGRAKASSAVGGIDFRAMNYLVQPMGSFKDLQFGLPILTSSALERIDLDKELESLRGLVKAGMVPSGMRVKEYLAACFQKGKIEEKQDDLLVCLAEIYRLAEEENLETSPELRESLVIVDTGKFVLLPNNQRAGLN